MNSSQKIFLSLAISVLALLPFSLEASHLTGADLQYMCIGRGAQDTMLLRVNIFRDCAGISAPTTISVPIVNSCGVTVTQTLSLTAVAGIEVSFLCGPLLASSTCNGGSLPGMEIYTYEATYILPPSCNGSLQASATGGTPGFNYSWPMGLTGSDIDMLCAGAYTVTIQDNNGCIINDTHQLSDITNLYLTPTVSTISCNGLCDGSISVAATNGTAPLVYNWQDGASGNSRTNLCPGIYSVTVMDADGSQFAYWVNLENPAPIFINFNIQDETCAGACDGIIRTNISGGKAPYTYSWTGGLTGNLSSSLCPGSFTLTVTDANGCTATGTAVVSGQAPVVSSYTLNSGILCYGASNASVTVSAIGGTSPYVFDWDNGYTGTTQVGLSAGTYTVSATDANGCIDIQNFVITQPTIIVSNPTITNSACLGSTGVINLAPSGGVGPYSYTWGILPNPGNVNSVTNLAAGSYTVTISDANGCSITEAIAVSNTGGASSSGAVVSQPTCYGNSDGSISLTPIGGTAPYTFLWSNASTASSITALAGGNYVVTITDNAGCMRVEVFPIVNPDSIKIAVTSINPLCFGTCDGAISIVPSGGNGAYNVAWSNGGTGLSQTNLCSGSYSVTVTDGNGCVDSVTNIVLTDPLVLTDSIAVINPILCNGKCIGQLKSFPSGGTAPYTYVWNTGSTLSDIYDLCNGTYTVTVTDANGCTVIDTMVLTQPAAIVPTISQLSAPGCTGLWSGGWGSCCRPAGAVNTPSANFYSDFRMNLSMEQGGCNSGVQFEDDPSAHPLRYVCLNDTLCYNFGATEPDGDSLIFELIPAKESATGVATYNTVGTIVYSGSNPINGITLNPSTGEICFVASPVGRFVVAIKVTEYDPVTGLYKGENMRDILFIVQSCLPNAAPVGSSIQNFSGSGGATLSAPNEISMCEGDDFCMELTFIDSNYAVDTNMFIFSNVTDLLVGPNPTDTATITNTAVDTIVTNGDTVLRIVTTICWTAPALSGGVYNFYVGVNDDHCTVPKDFFRAITVNVIGSTVAWPDQTICGNQNAQIFAAGGSSFSWQSISGDPVQVGVNFSCDSCAAPIAFPSQTTVYVVTSNISSICQNMDTVTITVAPDYQVIASPDTILCNLDTVQLTATATIPGTFTYQWNNATSLSDPTIYNPVAVPPGSTIYSVTMTSVDGCQKNSTANIFITPPFPLVNPIAVDTVLCDVGDTTQLGIEFLVANSNACGGSYSQCLSTTNYTILGTGTSSNSSTSYSPAPFGNYRKTARQQYMVKASELNAMGLSAGMITEIGFNVASINGNTSYQDYEVKMGCTTDTFMSGAFKPVPTVVFPAGTIVLSTGWNMIVLTTPYIWDGTSSLLIDVCFDMLNFASTSNSSTYYNSPGFTCTVGYNNNFTLACGNASVNTSGFARPNIRFGFCAGADPNAYLYSWYPNYNISNTTIADPFVWPDSTHTYSIIVNDTFGVCSDTADITIYVGELDAGPDTILCEGDSTLLNPFVTTICSNGTETYSWSPTTGLSDPNIMNPMATVFTTTTYVLTYSNSCGCTLMDSVTIEVNPFGNPNPILTHPTCGLADGEILLQSVGGSAPYTFSIDTGNTFVPTNLFTGLAMGGYAMQIMDSNGCLSPMLIDTLINPGTPVVDSIVLTDPSCFGFTDGQIAIYASGGTPPLRYSIDNATFTFNSTFSGLPANTYTVVVRDDSLCATFPQTVILESNTQLFLDSILHNDLLCYQDSSGWIEVFGHGGTSPLSYTISNGITYSQNALFTGLSVGSYPVIVKDSIGCTTNMQIQNIGQPAPLVATVNPVNDTCFNACGGYATVIVSGGTPPYNHSWKKGINVVGTNSPAVYGLCAGTDYEYKVVDSNNCELFKPFIVSQPDELIASFVPTNISCFGANDGRIVVSAIGGTAPYLFSIDGGVTFTSNPTFTGLLPGTYNIMVADSASRCDAVNTAIITEPSEITLTTNITEKKLCVAGCTQLVATAVGGVGPGYNYIWNQGLDSNGIQTACPVATTIYSVYAVDANGCTSTAHGIVLTLFDSLSVDAGPDHDLCPGDTAQLNALVTGGDAANGYNYVWNPVFGLSGGFIKNPKAYPSSGTLYTVKVTDNCETPARYDSVWVNIHPIPTMGFYADSPTEGCEPFDITLVNTSTPVQFAEWTIGDNIQAHGFKVDITDLQAGIYDVKLRVITPKGCENEITKKDFITVYALPDAKFTINPDQTTIFNTIIQFEDKSIGSINSWDWDFSGYGSSNDQNPVFQYPADTGTYPVTLTVTSTDGCVDKQEEMLRIGGEFNIYVPNSFTPNGDNQNDVFAPRAVGIDYDKYKLIIYDRWGGVVFESTNLNQPWDGRVQGSNKMAENGVYVWRIVAQDKTDTPEGHLYHGTVTLLR